MPDAKGRTGDTVRRTRSGLLFALLAGASLLASGCSALGSDGSSSGGNDKVEKAQLKVVVLQAIDVAPLFLGIQAGYFSQQGLDVKVEQVSSGQASLAKLTSGEDDIAFGSYVPFLAAKARGVADIKFVSDADSLAPRSAELMAMPGSSVKSVKDLPGKRIGVTATNTASDMLTKSLMKDSGVPFDTVRWVDVPLPQSAAALQDDSIDAAFMVEPFVTQAVKTVGAVPVADADTGSTQDFPATGYTAMSKFADADPKTVAAFQRGMARSVTAAADRNRLNPFIQQYSKVDQDTALLAATLKYGTTLDAKHLQRMADLMLELGVLERKLDVAPLIAPQTASS